MKKAHGRANDLPPPLPTPVQLIIASRNLGSISHAPQSIEKTIFKRDEQYQIPEIRKSISLGFVRNSIFEETNAPVFLKSRDELKRCYRVQERGFSVCNNNDRS